MKFDNIFTDDPSSKSFPAGSVIFEKGTAGEEMYVIKEGEVDIFIEGCHLETLSRDGIFGELCLIDQESRIASAVARTECVVQAINKRRFLFLVQETPLFAIRVMKVLADRLRRVDVLLAKWELEKRVGSAKTISMRPRADMGPSGRSAFTKTPKRRWGHRRYSKALV